MYFSTEVSYTLDWKKMKKYIRQIHSIQVYFCFYNQ